MSEIANTMATPPNISIPILDKITYLASLASEVQVIDPFLDEMRIITADLGPEKTLTAADETKLQTVYERVEDYLINHDPLRTFTKSDLERMIERNFTTAQSISFKTSRDRLLIAACITPLLAGIATYMTGGWLPSAEARASFAGVIVITTLYVFILLFYILALRKFKPELQNAYRSICIGIIFYGITTMSFLVLQLANPLQENVLFQYGGSVIGYTIGSVFIYRGLSQLLALLSIRSRLTSIGLMVLLSAITLTIGIFIPHPTYATDSVAFNLALASHLLCILYQGVGVWLATKAIRPLSIRYSRALKWFAWTMGILTFGTIIRTLWMLTSGDTTSFWSIAPFIIANILLLYAGYEFYRASQET